MIPIEVADLRDILLAMPVTHSETQATRWAGEIINKMKAEGWSFQREREPAA